jgi:ribosomal protein S18 acetylase RimI-like enzyme
VRVTPSADKRVVTVRGPLQGQGELCASILADLPEYFGLEESNAAYARAAQTLPSFVGAVDGRDGGLLLLRQTSDAAVELHLIAVLRAFHGVGLGGALVRAAEAHLRAQGVHWFHVKTLSSRDPDENYARTRAFYAAMGFESLEEIVEVWGPQNPCLLLVKRL